MDESRTAAAMASAIRMVNVYRDGGLWRQRLNYDENVLLDKQLRAKAS